MECGAVYTFTSPDQFWLELADILSLPPNSSLANLDYALRNYIAFASTYLEEYLAAPGALDQALWALLASPFFTSHVDRMTASLIALIHPSSPSTVLFIALMLVLHLGLSNPLSSSADLRHAEPGGVGGSSKVFKAMRKKWGEVVPVLLKCVEDAGIVEDTKLDSGPLGAVPAFVMPSEGWTERVGTAACAVLYEVCRVQRLSLQELSLFSYEFIEHLFTLVERTRDAEDETLNYTVIKLLIALNEQFMVSALPPPKAAHGPGDLPPPILPTIMGPRKDVKEANLVLEVLKRREGDSKTFGENIIFILNRSNGTPDSLCVSLLILKLLYLLFTTSGTHEYFYTNDLCVLVDVFIRELCDLGEESEGLRHTYLRVLHPLLTNTQLRHHPYKRPLLRRVLQSIISPSHFSELDPTTRRLVERNLRGSWCEGMTDDSAGAKREDSTGSRDGSESAAAASSSGLGWSSEIGRSKSADPYIAGGHTVTRVSSAPRAGGNGGGGGGEGALGLLSGTEATGSSLSVNLVAATEARDPGTRKKHHHKRHSGETRVPAIALAQASEDASLGFGGRGGYSTSPLVVSVPLSPVHEHAHHPAPPSNNAPGLLSPQPHLAVAPHSSFADESPSPHYSELPTPSSTPSLTSSPPRSSDASPHPRRRRPPPPPASPRPRTPSSPSPAPAESTTGSTTSSRPALPPTQSQQRRAAPEPPRHRGGHGHASREERDCGDELAQRAKGLVVGS